MHMVLGSFSLQEYVKKVAFRNVFLLCVCWVGFFGLGWKNFKKDYDSQVVGMWMMNFLKVQTDLNIQFKIWLS